MLDNIEVWKPINTLKEGLNGIYEISNLGRVRNIKTGHLFLNSVQKDGYRAVTFKNRLLKVQQTVRTHRLVAMYFLENQLEGSTQVNHKDGDKSNNIYSNLEWCTPQENIIHAKITGLNKNYGTTHGNSKLTEAEVLLILKSTGSCKNIGREFGVSASTVSLIKSGQRYNSVFEEYRAND